MPEGPLLPDGSFVSDQSWWNDLNRSFWSSGIFGDMKEQGFKIWNQNLLYSNAQKYLGLIILGYISYKTFK